MSVNILAESVIEKIEGSGGDKRLSYPVVFIKNSSPDKQFYRDLPSLLDISSSLYQMSIPFIEGSMTMQRATKESIDILKKHDLFPCHLISIGFGNIMALEMARCKAQELPHPSRYEDNFLSIVAIATARPQERSFHSFQNAMEILSKEVFSLLPEKLRPKLAREAKWDDLMSMELSSSFREYKHLWLAALYNARESLHIIERPLLSIILKDQDKKNWRSLPRLWESNPFAEMFILNKEDGNINERLPEIIMKFWEDIENYHQGVKI